MNKEILAELKSIHKRLDVHDQKIDQFDTSIRRHFDIGVEQIHSTVQLLAERMSDFIRSQGRLELRVESLEESRDLTNVRLNVLERTANS